MHDLTKNPEALIVMFFFLCLF